MPRLDSVRIVITRAAHQADELAKPLRDLGAEIILLPVIGIGPPLEPEPLRAAARHCNDFDWIIFTSVNAVRAFAAELPAGAQECQPRIATVGAATRRAAEQSGFQVAITPENYVAEDLIAALAAEDTKGKRILIPSAAVTREVVAGELRKRGAQVDVVEAYRNVVPSDAPARVREVFGGQRPDWVIFASSSAVENLVRLAGRDALAQVRIATIGAITSATVRKHGLNVTAEAAVSTAAALVEAVASFKASYE